MSEELKPLPCPFCGGEPTTLARPDNIDGTEFYAAVACYCGGYSACAHKGAQRKTQDDATAEAIAAWNRRAQPAAPAEPKGADGLPVSAPRLYADEEPPGHADHGSKARDLFDAAPLVAPEPAPGWCKHCRQYTIDEPLPATDAEPLTDARAEALAKEAFEAGFQAPVTYNDKLINSVEGAWAKNKDFILRAHGIEAAIRAKGEH